jgi:hypothetical protein
MGNAFLSHIRAVDGIFQVVRKCTSLVVNKHQLSTVITTNTWLCLCGLFIKFSITYFITGIFEDDTVTHIEEIVDPIRDMEIISNEVYSMMNNLIHSLCLCFFPLALHSEFCFVVFVAYCQRC